MTTLEAASRSATRSGVDATEDVVEALKQYFSAPIARALLTSTLRRARIDGAALHRQTIPEVITALEHALPMYIADAARRGECLARLRKLALDPAAEAQPPPASPAASPPHSNGLPTASTVIQVMTADDVSNACEVGRDIARQVGFLSVQQTKIATAIAELARNILLYAISGEIRIAAIDSPRKGVEIAARDEGPGIKDLELVMGGTYRSRTGMGLGLRGSKRLMDTFEIETSPKGTNVLARKFMT
ncbi:MAG: anti-sigma regulatory factor [Polyangiaceae bacterium]